MTILERYWHSMIWRWEVNYCFIVFSSILNSGLAKDDQILSDIGVTNGSKMMLVGSKPNDVISVNTKTDEVSTSRDRTATRSQPLSKQKPHLKVNIHNNVFLFNVRSIWSAAERGCLQIWSSP